MRSRTMRSVTGLLLLALALCGCGGPTFDDLPLPGTRVPGETITLTAEFEEALNLTDGAQVRVNGVDSGRVQSVAVRDFKAQVELEVRRSAQLREGATARLRYTTPLGELFVDVDNPATGPALRDGTRLGPRETSTAPTVEDALSQTSLLINGGGLAQVKVITDESNEILGGREGTVRDLLDRSAYAVGQLNSGKQDIDRGLRALDRVSTTLHQRRGVIRQALRDVRPASRVVRANLREITTLLTRLERFAGTANDVVLATRERVISLIREVGPVLQELVSVRHVLPATLMAIVRVADGLDNVVPGDWLNLGTRLHVDRGVLGTDEPTPGDGGLPGLPDVLGQLPDLPSRPGGGSLDPDGLLGGLLGGGR